MAMPIFGAGRRLIGALALSGPSSRLSTERASLLAPRLRDAAERLSVELGAQM